MFSGSIVAIVTPFKNGKVDEKRLRDLIELQIKNGSSGIVPCGTTGESATLSFQEHGRVIEITAEQVKARVPVIAGTGSNSTEEAIMLTRYAAEVGADGKKPDREGAQGLVFCQRPMKCHESLLDRVLSFLLIPQKA